MTEPVLVLTDLQFDELGDLLDVLVSAGRSGDRARTSIAAQALLLMLDRLKEADDMQTREQFLRATGMNRPNDACLRCGYVLGELTPKRIHLDERGVMFHADCINPPGKAVTFLRKLARR